MGFSSKENIKINYFKNGNIKEEYFFDPETGLKHGLSKEWHKNGQLWKKCFYSCGNLHGSYWEYNNKGELFENAEFVDNKLIFSSLGAIS